MCLRWVLGVLGGRRCGAHGAGLAALQTRGKAEKLRCLFIRDSLKLEAVIQGHHCLLLSSRAVAVIFKLREIG